MSGASTLEWHLRRRGGPIAKMRGKWRCSRHARFVEREMPEPGPVEVRVAPRLAMMPQRQSDRRRTAARPVPTACPGARDRRRDRHHWRGRRRLTRQVGLVWRAFRALQAVPARLADRLPLSAHSRHLVGPRLRRGDGGPSSCACSDSRQACRRRDATFPCARVTTFDALHHSGAMLR